VPRDERAFGAPLTDPAVPAALVDGDLEILGLMPRSSNYTFLARARGSDGDEVLTIYKPRRGEIPLWDFPEGTLAQREVAAYVVARSLGWPRVPPTVLRDGPEGPGSAQLFVEFDPDEHYFTLQERFADSFRDVALFDVAINNADRKAGHCLLARDGGVFLIDHGVCFNVEEKLRTVIWDFVDEPLAGARSDDLRRLADELGDAGPLRAALAPLLEPAEIEAMGDRARALVQAGRFPGPGVGRPYPWPPV
jgi:uncharacterized repeat protein (TIGR03843 family)